MKSDPNPRWCCVCVSPVGAKSNPAGTRSFCDGAKTTKCRWSSIVSAGVNLFIALTRVGSRKLAHTCSLSALTRRRFLDKKFAQFFRCGISRISCKCRRTQEPVFLVRWLSHDHLQTDGVWSCRWWRTSFFKVLTESRRELTRKVHRTEGWGEMREDGVPYLVWCFVLDASRLQELLLYLSFPTWGVFMVQGPKKGLYKTL